MTPWLTFVVGIIVGLLIGWLIDLLYRRAPRPPAEVVDEPLPQWAQPVEVVTVAPELSGVATAASAAVESVSAATEDEGLDTSRRDP